MCSSDNKLPPAIVRSLLSIVEQDEPIVVGGQAISIWAERYRPSVPELFERGSLASKDLDFFKNESAVRRLVRELGAKVSRARMDDHTPNAALVQVTIMGRPVTIDFMKQLKGIKENIMIKRRVILKEENGPNGEKASICVMHPMDCAWSRFANINLLHRVEDHSVSQGRASLLVLAEFILEEIDNGRSKEAQRLLMELCWLARQMHAGKHTHVLAEAKLHPEDVVRAFSDHEAFDARWRELTLGREIARMDADLIRLSTPSRPRAASQG